jgi:hypothetical protein
VPLKVLEAVSEALRLCLGVAHLDEEGVTITLLVVQRQRQHVVVCELLHSATEELWRQEVPVPFRDLGKVRPLPASAHVPQS